MRETCTTRWQTANEGWWQVSETIHIYMHIHIQIYMHKCTCTDAREHRYTGVHAAFASDWLTIHRPDPTRPGALVEG